MARPRKSSKKVPHRQADLSNLSTEVLRLRLQAQNLPITGSRSQLIRTLRAAKSGSASPLNTRSRQISGRVQKRPNQTSGRTRIALVVQEPHHTRIFLPNLPPLQPLPNSFRQLVSEHVLHPKFYLEGTIYCVTSPSFPPPPPLVQISTRSQKCVQGGEEEVCSLE